MRENRNFIKSTELSGLVPVMASGESAVASFGLLIDEIAQLCGREAAGLFAEPVFPRGGEGEPSAVSWYGWREGAASELAGLDEIARRPVVERLESRIRGLRPALEDARIGPILRAWLNIGSDKDILVIGGEPVLVSWGHVPAGTGVSEEARRAHEQRTFGRFLPRLAELGLAGSTRSEGRDPELDANPPRPPPRPPVPRGGPYASSARDDPPPPWRAPLIASCVAAVLLLALLLPGVLVYPAASDHDARNAFEIERLKASNESLEAQIGALGAASKDRKCRAPGDTIPVPGLPVPGGAQPKEGRMELLPPSPDKAALAPPPSGEANVRTVADLLEKSTVLVFALKPPDGYSLGSGFFISDKQIVTNHHVVAGTDSQLVFVASQALGGVRHARVAAKTEPPPDSQDLKPDFAVLEVEPVRQAAILKLGATPPKLSTAYVAGFPGFLTRQDAAFKTFLNQVFDSVGTGMVDEALLRQYTAVPGSDLRYGRVNNVIVSQSGQLPIIIHDMQLAGGNSGGPLVDSCGRLGGVNTLVFSEPKIKHGDDAGADVRALGNVAQDVSVLRQFLKAQQIAFQSDDKSCDGAIAQLPVQGEPQLPRGPPISPPGGGIPPRANEGGKGG
ncbi:MAG: serine protease [Beijerinckiaceae bacterium]|nr:serine protease [Beijerinckiaceae bacterium]